MRCYRVLSTLVTILMLGGGLALGQSNLTLPVEDSIYDDLAHFRALGVWNGSLELRPMSRREICFAAESIAKHGEDLSPPDIRRLLRLRKFCSEETGERAGTWLPGALNREAAAAGFVHPNSYWEPGLTVRLRGGPSDLGEIVDIDRRPRRHGALILSMNAEIAGRLSAELRFYEDYSKYTPHPGSSNWVDNLPKDPLTSASILTDPSARLDRAVLAYSSGWWGLRIGREDRHWGQGRRGTFLLSENPFPLDGISFHFKTRYVRGATLFAQSRRGEDPPPLLLGEPYAGELHEAGEAYVAVHRFEIGPLGPATFGLAEAVAYGGRGIDFGYLNPVAFLLPVTQDIVDRSGANDKKLLCLDLRFDLAPLTLYGEFLLDRYVGLDAAEGGEESDISSYGELAGLRWASPFGLEGADLDMEYAHIDPQVYFHPDSDVRRFYMTEDKLGEGGLIGHWLGPNSDDLYIRFLLPRHHKWGRFGLEFEQTRWGVIDGKRGTELGFVSMSKAEKEWITGDIERERWVALRWEKAEMRGITPGSWRAEARLAHVDRSGAPGGDGWQAELRLDWRLTARIQDSGGDPEPGATSRTK